TSALALAAVIVAAVSASVAWRANTISQKETNILARQTSIMQANAMPVVTVKVDDVLQPGEQGPAIVVANSARPLTQFHEEYLTSLRICETVEPANETEGSLCSDLWLEGLYAQADETGEATGTLLRLSDTVESPSAWVDALQKQAFLAAAHGDPNEF